MGFKKRTWRGRAALLTAAAGLALSAGNASAIIIDGVEGIGDFVWEDLDMDGMQDLNEPGIPGVTVTLLRDSDKSQIGGSVVTDGNGEYGFGFDLNDDLANVDLIVQFTDLPAGYIFTLPKTGGDTIDSDVTDPALGRTGPVSYFENEFNLDVDAGAYFRAAVPEPGLLALLAFGFAGIGVLARKKRRS